MINQYTKLEYTYEVELIYLNDLIGKHSIVHTEEFKKFYKEQMNKKENKIYDLDVNIRDLYPIDIHFKGRNEDDIVRFKKLNDIILSKSNNISRRVTKKEIVYKKDKCRSIVSFKIRHYGSIIIYLFKDVEQFDVYNRFITISKNNCKPLEKCFYINNDEDLKYIEFIIDKYLDKILN